MATGETVERLLQEFEQPVSDTAGAVYKVYLYGRSRPADTWQGWLVFERLSDGQRFATGIETTQPNAEAVLYWATGLTDAYFDGALVRAQRPVEPDPPSRLVSEPLVEGGIDSATRQQRLAELERAVLACFANHRAQRLLTRQLLDDLNYAHADVVRALEDLEKQGGLLIRRTEEGNDFVFLTQAGAELAGVAGVSRTGVVADRQLPKMR